MTKEELLAECGIMFSIHRRDIVGPARFDFIMPARFAMYKALRECGLSFPQIGKFMNRHHTTVMHGIDVCGDKMKAHPSYAKKVSRLIELATMKPVPYTPLAA